MKLNEIKEVVKGEVDLAEGVIPVHISLTLEQVIRDGKISNNVQYFVIAALVEMFKNGGPTRWPRDLNDYSMSTNAELIEGVKQLSDKEAVAVAVWLCESLIRPVEFEKNPFAANPFSNPALNVVDWMRFVIKKQA
jgi:hypothetical protein